MTNDIIKIDNISVVYNAFQLKNLSLNLPKGEIIGFVGENGAGKTTTIKAILNLVPLEQGTIQVFSKDSVKYNTAIKKEVGTVLDDCFFYEDFKLKEIENIMLRLYPTWDTHYFHSLLRDHHIDSQKKFKEYSKGMQAKVKLFLALAHHPTLLLLDEPTTGLDPVSRDEILALFQDFMTDDKAIFFSSHITSDLDKIADRIVLIHEGAIQLTESQLSLDENYGIVTLTHQDYEDLGTELFLATIQKEYHVTCLINNKQSFIKEFPDFKVTTPKIEDILLMLKKGGN